MTAEIGDALVESKMDFLAFEDCLESATTLRLVEAK